MKTKAKFRVLKRNHLLIGDVRETLKSISSGKVQCVVTSPPYFGLRDYQTATWAGGDENCDHQSTRGVQGKNGQRADRRHTQKQIFKEVCGKCGAVRVDKQIGLETSVTEYVATLVEVFREVRRVLRDDGLTFLNLGDSYASSTKGSGGGWATDPTNYASKAKAYGARKFDMGTAKAKDLIGVPWRVAFALQEDGWYLRQDVIWSKPNAMPESVTDRCTKAHEYVFILSKNPRYFSDFHAIRTTPKFATKSSADHRGHGAVRDSSLVKYGLKARRDVSDGGCAHPLGAAPRSVWEIPSKSFKGAHFATFPRALAARCVMAGTSPRGACPECGAAWRRVVEGERVSTRPGKDTKIKGRTRKEVGNRDPGRHVTVAKTVGFEPTCQCGRKDTVPCVVYDPFFGAGTVGVVCKLLHRDWVGTEINPEYAELALRRIDRTQRPMLPLFGG